MSEFDRINEILHTIQLEIIHYNIDFQDMLQTPENIAALKSLKTIDDVRDFVRSALVYMSILNIYYTNITNWLWSGKIWAFGKYLSPINNPSQLLDTSQNVGICQHVESKMSIILTSVINNLKNDLEFAVKQKLSFVLDDHDCEFIADIK